MPQVPPGRHFTIPATDLRLDGEAWPDGNGASFWIGNASEALVSFDVTGSWEDRSDLWVGFEGFSASMLEEDHGDEEDW